MYAGALENSLISWERREYLYFIFSIAHKINYIERICFHPVFLALDFQRPKQKAVFVSYSVYKMLINTYNIIGVLLIKSILELMIFNFKAIQIPKYFSWFHDDYKVNTPNILILMLIFWLTRNTCSLRFAIHGWGNGYFSSWSQIPFIKAILVKTIIKMLAFSPNPTYLDVVSGIVATTSCRTVYGFFWSYARSHFIFGCSYGCESA